MPPINDPHLLRQLEQSQGEINRAESGVGGGRRRPGAGPSMTPQQENYLNQLREQSRTAGNSLEQYRRAGQAITRSNMTPDRAAQIEGSIAEAGDGTFGMLGRRINRWVNGVDDTEIEDFQYLRGLASGQVLDRQIEQAGPQTDTDANRMAMTEIDPFKDRNANLRIINEGMLRAFALQRRAPFYIEWANRHGLNGMDEHGRTADAAWQEFEQEARERLRTAQTDNPDVPLTPVESRMSARDLTEYRALAERGASAAELRDFVRSHGGGELVNAEAIVAARRRGAPVRTDVQYQEGPLRIRRVN